MASTLTVSKVSAAGVSPSVTSPPSMRELAKKYVIYENDGPTVDFSWDTTCGIIPRTLASQYGLFQTTTSASHFPKNGPYPIVCDGLCASQGNYLGCIEYKTASVASACVDFGVSTARCKSGMPCWWDLQCESTAPYCNQNIYQGSVTQFTCAPSRYAPVTVQTPISMVSWTPVLPDQTPLVTSTRPPFSLSRTLDAFNLSLAGFIGICIAVGIALIAAIWFCCWRRRRRNKAKYGKVQYVKVPYEHSSQSNISTYQYQYQQQQPPMQGSYQHYPQYYNQYQHQH